MAKMQEKKKLTKMGQRSGENHKKATKTYIDSSQTKSGTTWKVT